MCQILLLFMMPKFLDTLIINLKVKSSYEPIIQLVAILTRTIT